MTGARRLAKWRRCAALWSLDILDACQCGCRVFIAHLRGEQVAPPEPPPFKMRKEAYGGTCATYRVLGDPEARLAAVLQAEDMIGSRLSPELKPKTSPERPVDPGLTGAFVPTQKSANAALKSERERKFFSLVKQYDPYQAAPGSALSWPSLTPYCTQWLL